MLVTDVVIDKYTVYRKGSATEATTCIISKYFKPLRRYGVEKNLTKKYVLGR